ncbi:MAG: 1,4-dihydroxy-2-naphthoate polyprenyltransferase [Verrucomicrobiota bacterium]
MHPVKIWILAIRPKTLWAGFAPVLIGTAMAWEADGFHLASALVALLSAMLIQIGTNFCNDYADFKKGADTEERKGPLRVTQAGLVAPRTMLIATTLVFVLFALSFFFLVSRGGWPIVLIGVLSIISGIAYTAGPYPLGYHGLGDLFVLIFFGPVATACTYYVQVQDVSGLIVLAGFSPGLLSVAILTVNNLRDIDGDRVAGKRTLAVRFGKNFVRMEYILCIVFALLIPVNLILLTRDHYYALLVLLLIPVAIPAIRKVLTSTEGPVLNPVLAFTAKMLLIYSVLFSVGWIL